MAARASQRDRDAPVPRHDWSVRHSASVRSCLIEPARTARTWCPTPPAIHAAFPILHCRRRHPCPDLRRCGQPAPAPCPADARAEADRRARSPAPETGSSRSRRPWWRHRWSRAQSVAAARAAARRSCAEVSSAARAGGFRCFLISSPGMAPRRRRSHAFASGVQTLRSDSFNRVVKRPSPGNHV